jgi:hypothetical protein
MSPDLFGRNGNSQGFGVGARRSDSAAAQAVRRQLVARLAHAELSAEEKTSMYSAPLDQIKDRQLLERVATEAGLSLSHFLTNGALSLYFAVRRGRYDLGYIAKGWGDPGFRVGEVLTFEAYQGVSFIWTGEEIRRFCATNGIGITFAQHGETTELHLDGTIYTEGFNRATFLKTLEALKACVEKIETLSARR